MLKRHLGAVAVSAALLGLVGCSGGTGTATPATHVIGDDAIVAADVVARGGIFQHPLDAAPSPDGTTIYFVATGEAGPGVFSVATESGAVTPLAVGAPMFRPSAVAVSTDGGRLFAADSRTGSADAPGAILTASTGIGPVNLTVLDGTQGRSVRGLDVLHRDGGDVVYFTGTDPTTGASGVFEVPSSGGTASTVAQGGPFASLDSVAVTAKGVAYVTDRGAVPGQGAVYRIGDGAVTQILHDLHLGAPAGLALVDNDATLLVSSNDAGTQADQLLFLDLATGKTAAAGRTIGANKDTSGGLHRASSSQFLAWADTAGQIYRIRLRR